MQEAWEQIGGCLFQGGDKLVDLLFKLHPEWNLIQCRAMTRDEQDTWVTIGIVPELCK